MLTKYFKEKLHSKLFLTAQKKILSFFSIFPFEKSAVSLPVVGCSWWYQIQIQNTNKYQHCPKYQFKLTCCWVQCSSTRWTTRQPKGWQAITNTWHFFFNRLFQLLMLVALHSAPSVGRFKSNADLRLSICSLFLTLFLNASSTNWQWAESTTSMHFWNISLWAFLGFPEIYFPKSIIWISRA